jgi:alpha-ketoglutarate-dependent taurine dioxygenase
MAEKIILKRRDNRSWHERLPTPLWLMLRRTRAVRTPLVRFDDHVEPNSERPTIVTARRTVFSISELPEPEAAAAHEQLRKALGDLERLARRS